jgi:hypothetical protein
LHRHAATAAFAGVREKLRESSFNKPPNKPFAAVDAKDAPRLNGKIVSTDGRAF